MFSKKKKNVCAQDTYDPFKYVIELTININKTRKLSFTSLLLFWITLVVPSSLSKSRTSCQLNVDTNLFKLLIFNKKKIKMITYSKNCSLAIELSLVLSLPSTKKSYIASSPSSQNESF